MEHHVPHISLAFLYTLHKTSGFHYIYKLSILILGSLPPPKMRFAVIEPHLGCETTKATGRRKILFT